MAQLIPVELMIEILQYLPVKSLLRFRCLSKSLRAVIDSPNFINLHLSKSSRTFNPRKLIFQSMKDFNFHVCDVNVDLEEESLSCPQKSFSFPWNGYCVGYCNGLLLLIKRNSRLALWNPSTRQCRDLPVCPYEVLPNVHSYQFVASGLAYDDFIDDYKAFFMVSVREKLEFEIQFWVYELRSNIWRRSQNLNHLEYNIHIDNIDVIGYFADGSLHFLCQLNDLKSEIVAFDIRKETFSLVPQPVLSIRTINEVRTELHVLGGHLCISYFSNSMLAQADLYMRKKDGIDLFTWTKFFSVTDPVSIGGVKEPIIDLLDCINVLGYAKRGDKLLLDLGVFTEEKTMYVISYDLKDESFVKVETNKDPIWDCSVVCLQVESLVSVGGGATV